MSSQEWIVTIVKLFFAAGGVVAIVAFVIVPLVRMLRTGPDAELLDPYSKLPESVEGEELEIPVGGEKRKLERGDLVAFARRDPRLAATLVSRWLRERK
jgi:flagellar biosynthesis/type III secretory pathway M-ring protein FliF/YscJ